MATVRRRCEAAVGRTAAVAPLGAVAVATGRRLSAAVAMNLGDVRVRWLRDRALAALGLTDAKPFEELLSRDGGEAGRAVLRFFNGGAANDEDVTAVLLLLRAERRPHEGGEAAGEAALQPAGPSCGPLATFPFSPLTGCSVSHLPALLLLSLPLSTSPFPLSCIPSPCALLTSSICRPFLLLSSSLGVIYTITVMGWFCLEFLICVCVCRHRRYTRVWR